MSQQIAITTAQNNAFNMAQVNAFNQQQAAHNAAMLNQVSNPWGGNWVNTSNYAGVPNISVS